MRLVLVFAAATTTCLLAACMRAPGNTNTGNAPQAVGAPAVAAVNPDALWLQQSPLRAKMRAMWLSAGVIAQHGSAPERADWDSVECAGDDIARKAALMAGFWEQVRDAAKGIATSANSGNWDAAADHNHRLWKGCCDCHVENWAPEVRAFTPEVLALWRENGATPDAPWGDAMARRLQAPPREPYVAIMRDLNERAWAAGNGINARDKAVILDQTKTIHDEAERSARAWRDLERRGRRIAELARLEQPATLRVEYDALASACTNCHAQQVAGARELLNPPRWP